MIDLLRKLLPLSGCWAPGAGTGFQTFVNKELPPGLPGDFAGANIRANVIAGPWNLYAPPSGTTIGAAVWADTTNGIASNYYRPNSFAGFVHREGQALITEFLGIASAQILPGDPVTVMSVGDYWGLFAGGGNAAQKVYANPITGALSAAAAGGSVTLTGGAGTIAAGVLTVTVAPSSATLAAGQIIDDMAGLPHGTYIASLGTGTGGTGTYNLANIDGTAIPNIGSATDFTAFGVQELQYYLMQPIEADADFTASLAIPAAGTAFGVLTVSAVASGEIVPGQWLSATGLPGSANVQILEQLTGTAGGDGTYLTTNVFYVIGSTNTFVATAGKLGKISSLSNWV